MEGRSSFYFVHFFRKRPIRIEGIRKTTVFFFPSKLSSLFSCPLSLTKHFVLLITSIAENYSGWLAQVYYRLPLCFSWYRICLQCGRPGFEPWVGKIPWRREWQPTPVFWPGEFHELYGPWGRKESDMTERPSLHFTSQITQKNFLQTVFNIV